MPKFGRTSKKNLASCTMDIQRVLKIIIRTYDISVVSGRRTAEEQFKLFKKGRKRDPRGGRRRWVKIKGRKTVTNCDGYKIRSNHQSTGSRPCKAADVVPYPKMWKSKEELAFMAGMVKAVSNRLLGEGRNKKPVLWGGRWKNFPDFPHIYQK